MPDTTQVPVHNPATNRLLYIAAGFAGLVVMASVILGIGENADTKMDFFKWAVSAAGLVIAAGLSAAGYSTGKLFEGTTAVGFVPTLKAIAQVSAMPKLEQLAGKLDLTAAEREALPPLDTSNPNDLVSKTIANPSSNPNDWVAATGAKAPKAGALAIALMLLPFLGGGCVGTSAQFQKTIPGGVNNIVLDMRDYTAAHDWDINHNGTVDPIELQAKGEETKLTETLAATIASEKDIVVEDVEAAWKPVEPRWRNYVANDPTLAGDALSTKIRTDTGDSINKLIAVEKERQATLRSSLGLFAGSAGK